VNKIKSQNSRFLYLFFIAYLTALMQRLIDDAAYIVRKQGTTTKSRWKLGSISAGIFGFLGWLGLGIWLK
jgi:hypothetical protein